MGHAHLTRTMSDDDAIGSTGAKGLDQGWDVIERSNQMAEPNVDVQGALW